MSEQSYCSFHPSREAQLRCNSCSRWLCDRCVQVLGEEVYCSRTCFLLDFGKRLKHAPMVFSTNYFLKSDGRFLNQKVDKKVWLMWMEGRVHGEYRAIETPIGHIPRHEDLRALFQSIFSRQYTVQEYEQQFSIRIDRFLEKIDRMEKIYAEEQEVPASFSACLQALKTRLIESRRAYGRGVVSPTAFTA